MKGPFGRVSPPEVLWWTTVGFLGLGRFTFPRELVGYSGMGAVYGFAMLCAVAYGSGLLIVALMRRFPGWTAIEIAVATMGTGGRVFEFVMGSIMLLILAEAYSLFAFLLRESTLPFTPVWAVLALAGAAVAYGMAVGVEAISRTLRILGPFFLAVALAGATLIFTRARLTMMIPHWTGWGPELRGAYSAVYILSGLQSVFIFSGFAPSGSLRRGVLLGLTTAFTVLVAVLFGTIGSLGVDALPLITWPAAMLARALDVPGFYVERVGFISMIAVIGSVLLFLIETTVVVAVAMTQTLALPNSAYRLVGGGVVVLTVIGAILIPNVSAAEYIARSVVSPLTLFMLLAKPLILAAAVWAAVHRAKRAVHLGAPPARRVRVRG